MKKPVYIKCREIPSQWCNPEACGASEQCRKEKLKNMETAFKWIGKWNMFFTGMGF